ncbi:hypothetical protein HUT16_19550 [Kitasatospora sp. NA04385]|uniref:hypothetical protein n=1 Tax=Kitasatospora sp. NA04385 TaxID=2742135 RepID=UPI0015917235|nr:hypothetical protein [Kitasatospora sp. NA04385]QKW20957.1 hypothetical protein HUT16_19550 [Kitasatospora sp. NA04385]
MHLVHARLLAPVGRVVPPALADAVRARALPADAVEHVSVHPQSAGEVTVGVFSLAPGLAEAERRAAALLRRTVAREPALAGFTVLSVEVVLVPGPWWDAR